MMKGKVFAEHIVHRYDEELEALRAKVLRIGGMVEGQLDQALAALRDADGERAMKVVSADAKVNRLEVEIDEECCGILARRSPVAGDLRLVIGIIKTVTDLERMGDEAVRVARMGGHLSARSGTPTPANELRHLGSEVQTMMTGALDAFARMDPVAAVAVVERDRSVDREYESLSRELITFMMEDPRTIPRGLDVMFAARALERIGDRACNICEYVIYIVKGADVRHTSLDRLQQTARSSDA